MVESIQYLVIAITYGILEKGFYLKLMSCKWNLPKQSDSIQLENSKIKARLLDFRQQIRLIYESELPETWRKLKWLYYLSIFQRMHSIAIPPIIWDSFRNYYVLLLAWLKWN